MKLYEEILLLKHFFKGKYVVENVIPYYTPLIEAQKIDRHLYWANFEIEPYEFGVDKIARGSVDYWAERYGYELSDLVGVEKRKVLRNCVNPKAGLLILNSVTGDM